jgi:aryl-alcohol dehydrogenase-like predicted oxidoreductase
MRRIVLPETGLLVSRFSFGTASLHHIGGANQQADHLRAAADAGFSHFDTAPLYGFGASERALGCAFGDGRDSGLTIATKVGLYPPGSGDQSRPAMLLRKALGRVAPTLSRARANWEVARARASLDGSLRRLRSDRVNFLFLHEPWADLVATDEWLSWLGQEVTTGRVGAFGIAGSSTRVEAFVAAASPLSMIVQTKDSVTGREADFMSRHRRRLQFTYGYLSKAGAPHGSGDFLAGVLARNTTGSIVVSTRNRSRLAEFSAAAEMNRG